MCVKQALGFPRSQTTFLESRLQQNVMHLSPGAAWTDWEVEVSVALITLRRTLGLIYGNPQDTEAPRSVPGNIRPDHQ